MKSYCIHNDIRGENYRVLVDFLGRNASLVQLVAHDVAVSGSCLIRPSRILWMLLGPILSLGMRNIGEMKR